MNSFSFQETRRNPQTARKVTFHLTFLSQRPFLKQEGSFSSTLFNDPNSGIIRNRAKESKFIQGMAKGSLDPNVYGGYMVQDAAYCFNAVDSYERAAEKMQEVGKPEFSLLYRTQSESFKRYNHDFLQKWRLRNSDSVAMGPAAATYVGYKPCLEPKRSQVPLHCHVTMYHAMALDCRSTHRFSREEQPILRLIWWKQAKRPKPPGKVRRSLLCPSRAWGTAEVPFHFSRFG